MKWLTSFVLTIALVGPAAASSAFGGRSSFARPEARQNKKSTRDTFATRGESAGIDVLRMRGGASFPVEADKLALAYAVIYMLHGTYIQYSPHGMSKFYGATNQVKGSLDDITYSWAGACQLGAGMLMILSKQMDAERAIAYSFLPYVANIVSVVDYNARTPKNAFDIGLLTLTALWYGGACVAVLLEGANVDAKFLAYPTLAIGLWCSLATAQESKFEGPNIDGNAMTIALWRGRGIIMALHGLLATMLLNGVSRLDAIGWFTSIFVVVATTLGHIIPDRRDMHVTNLIAWNGWIVSSAIVALGTLWIK